jgi:hypothetical protein
MRWMNLDGPSRRIICEPLVAPVTRKPADATEVDPGRQAREPAAEGEPARR